MDYKIVEVKENILLDNDLKAKKLRQYLKEKHIFMINVMASPGSGKTTLLIRLINQLKNKYKIGVMEADIDGDVDAKKISEITGIKTIQIHTSGACHLTAQMVEDAIRQFDIDGLNLLFLENVGNLVCPAEFDTGANINMMLLSVPEGDDKPLKYPLVFEVSQITVITKMDTQLAFDFDITKCEENIRKRNKNIKIFPTSAIENQGIDELANYIDNLIICQE